MTLYHNNDKSEHVIINIDKHIKRIAISMSGGVDSTILSYLYCKEIKEKNLDVKILPVTWRRPYPEDNPKTWNITHAKKVIDAIQLLLDVDNIYEDHFIFYPMHSTQPLTEEQEYKEWNRLQEICVNKGCDIFVYGSTTNPPLQVMKQLDLVEHRQVHRDKETPREDTYIKYNPFGNVDKKFLRDLYDQHNLLDTLFPLTRSCEGDTQWTRNYVLECGTCWWCKERYWAFGKPR